MEGQSCAHLMSPVDCEEIQRDTGLDVQKDHSEALGLNELAVSSVYRRGEMRYFPYQIGKDAVLK